MDSQLLTIGNTTLAAAEDALRDYMQGLDVRLTPVSRRQALLAGPHARALVDTYTPAGAARILAHVGVVRAASLSPADAAAVLRSRDLRDLPARSVRAPLNWQLDNTFTRSAWQLVAGAPGQIDWAGVRIGQIDTGYTAHPAFGFGAVPWVDTAAAETFFEPDSNGPQLPPPEPGHGLDTLHGYNGGHGTKSGSTVVGRALASSQCGVAPGCPIVPVRICDAVLINEWQPGFVQAVDHLLGHGAQVIVACLGIWGAITTASLKRAIDRAYERGVIVVCAAGQYVGSVVSPASLRRTVAVAGTTHEDVPWGHSCHGDAVDLSAPAADIRSAATKLKSGQPHYGYADGGDGTTYATAMVGGAAALWLLRHRTGLPGAYPEPWQRVEAFKRVVRGTARVPAGWPVGFGTGILNVRALLEAALPAAADLQKDPPA